MILQSEIRQIAEIQQFSPATIDKDWVLGHLLAGIYSDGELKDTLIFKGGTCLKKCYYPQYRFSEDLDFTLKNSEYRITIEQLESIIRTVSSKQEIPFFIRDFRTVYYEDKEVGWDMDLRYWGANHGRFSEPTSPDRWVDKVKLEIRQYELLVTDPVRQTLIHPYSDIDTLETTQVPCYSISEILSEKLRSLIQRSYVAARDCYDIWYISTHESSLDWQEIKEVFYSKSAFKRIKTDEIKAVFTDTNINRISKSWERSLGNHLPESKLPDCNSVIKEIEALIQSVFSD